MKKDNCHAMLSATFAFGPPMDMKVTPARHCEGSEESGFVSLSQSRFLVGPAAASSE
jgi:hypothetical protein